MGNTVSKNGEIQRYPSEQYRPRMNSMSSLDTITSKYSINNLVNRLKQKKSTQSSTSHKTSNRSSIEYKPQDGYTPSPVDNSQSQATLISESDDQEIQKKIYSSELVLQELYLSPETSPERRKDRDRRHRQHYLFKRIWSGNHKVTLDNPTTIIHWCCASAVWDIELAFEFPNARVYGIDYETATVSSLTNTIKNFSFVNANIHEGDIGLEQFQDNSVDYIMMRDVWIFNTPNSKWKTLLNEVQRVLKPGGYIEIFEQSPLFKSMGPFFTHLEHWSTEFYKAIQYDPQTIYELKNYLHEAGFYNIIQETMELPVGEWSESKETGYLQKDLVERVFREGKRWLCSYNKISDKDFIQVLLEAMEECEEYNTTVQQFYYCAQKKPMSKQA